MPEPSAFEVELAIEKQKVTNHQVLIKSQMNCLRKGVEQLAMRSINFFLYGVNLDSRMLDKILYVVGKSNMPL